MQSQVGHEGTSQDEAVTRVANNAEVGYTAREYDEQGRSEEHVMGSRKDQKTSAYSEDNIDA